MYWDPFNELNRMHDEMDKLFSSVWGHNSRQIIGHAGEKSGNKHIVRFGARTPISHIHETETKIIATFELPGVDKKDIELIVDDDHIELSVKSKQEKKSKDMESFSYMAESYQRRLLLLKQVDSNKASAQYKNGILRVEVPKKHKEKSKGKRINVE